MVRRKSHEAGGSPRSQSPEGGGPGGAEVADAKQLRDGDDGIPSLLRAAAVALVRGGGGGGSSPGGRGPSTNGGGGAQRQKDAG
jgi:hypothetical protein